ncbi:hypothetical protein [Halobacteriaceae bacterium SHR40]|uniref:hypothetical protein n=1 Tax=Halovenus amylolytica TaxID=2500550 RepID=UPI000FE36160
MLQISGIGLAGALGLGSAHAQQSDQGDQGGQNGERNSGGRGGQYTPYGGQDTKTAPELGTFDHVLAYLAEGIVDGPTESPEEFQPDPTLIKWFQEGLMRRTPEEVRDDRQACHDHWLDVFGLDLEARHMGETWLVDAGTLVPPLGGSGPKASWVKDGNGPDEFTGEKLEEGEGVTTENMYKTFVWFPDPEGDETNAVIPETPLMLDEKIGYTNYFKSGTTVPANSEPDNDVGGTTNRKPFVPNKIRDGGYWIFAVEDDGIPLSYLQENLEESEVGRPTFWFNTQADGEKRMGRGVAGGRESGVDPQDKLYLDGVGPDSAVHDGLPQQVGFFWGDYNIYRGENQDPLIIHYDSRFPTEFNPHSGIPRAFMCELQCAEFETERNPLGLGRVHGSTYPAATTYGNVNGHNFREDGPPEGFTASTIRNMLTFPPSLTRGREADDEIRAFNIAPGLPEDAFESQTEIPGYPGAFR